MFLFFKIIFINLEFISNANKSNDCFQQRSRVQNRTSFAVEKLSKEFTQEDKSEFKSVANLQACRILCVVYACVFVQCVSFIGFGIFN